MPLYHLNVVSQGELIEDEEGVEYPDYATAVVEAVRGARCLMTGEVASGTLCMDQAIEICDEAGHHLTTVPFTEAVKVVAVPEGTGEERARAAH
jgi:hypothetical protein